MKHKTKNLHWGSSLKYLKWDGKETSNDEKMISSTVHEWYEAKHRNISREELTFINDLSIYECPFCSSKLIIKYGH